MIYKICISPVIFEGEFIDHEHPLRKAEVRLAREQHHLSHMEKRLSNYEKQCRRIAMNFIFGFDARHEMDRSHFRLCDTLPYAEDGTLEEKLKELFGEEK